MQKQDKQSRDELLTRAAQEDQTPDDSLSPEALKRKRNREKKRKERECERKEKAASTARDEREWREGNRSTLKPQELKAMQEQDAYIRDLLFSMETVADVQSDPVLTEIVEDLVKENGTTHLGNASKNDLPPDWPSRQYWRDAELMERLTGENPQTEQYIRYGLLAALPDWRVVQFLTEKAGWTWQQAADLVGLHTDHLDHVRYR